MFRYTGRETSHKRESEEQTTQSTQLQKKVYFQFFLIFILNKVGIGRHRAAHPVMPWSPKGGRTIAEVFLSQVLRKIWRKVGFPGEPEYLLLQPDTRRTAGKPAGFVSALSRVSFSSEDLLGSALLRSPPVSLCSYPAWGKSWSLLGPQSRPMENGFTIPPIGFSITSMESPFFLGCLTHPREIKRVQTF